jgi:hypothetical protein
VSTDTRTEPDVSAPPGPPPRLPVRRSPWQMIVVTLLILVPVGYGAIAAMQSRATDGDRLTSVERAGLLPWWPSRAQRTIYHVPVPYNAANVAYFESNTWQHNSLFVQFTTTAGGLDSFLATLGTSRAALHDGQVTVTPAQAGLVGWSFTPGHHWAGLVMNASGVTPVHRVTVDLDNPDYPSVYVVSTTTFG